MKPDCILLQCDADASDAGDATVNDSASNDSGDGSIDDAEADADADM